MPMQTFQPSPPALAPVEVRDLMWRSVGLFRTREGLGEAVDVLARAQSSASPATAAAWRERNLLTVARLIAGAALRREESRGGHFRADFPQRDDDRWKIPCVYHRLVKDTEDEQSAPKANPLECPLCVLCVPLCP